MPAPTPTRPTPIFTEAHLDAARRTVTDLDALAPPHLRLLAWASLKTARGQRTRQGVVNSLITGRRTQTGALIVRRTP